MPQTKFVLRKALELSLPVIVCINKIDRPEARPLEVVDEVLELLMDLDASDEQLDCPFLFASAKDGYAVRSLDDEPKDMAPLFETCLLYTSVQGPESQGKDHRQGNDGQGQHQGSGCMDDMFSHGFSSFAEAILLL